MPITGRVLEVAATDPDRLAIVGDDGESSYAALIEDSRRLIAAIDGLHAARPVAPATEARGIPITAVSVASAFQTARIVAGLAGFRAVSAVVDPRWPLAHRVGIIVRCGIGVVVSEDSDLGDALRERAWAGTVITPDELHRREAATQPAAPPTVRDGDEPFLLLFSSGTTSDPKAFIKTRRQYRENFAVSSAHLEPRPGEATLAPGPVSYSLTLYALIECLASGGTAHVADAFDARAALRCIQAHGITRVVAVPAIVRALTAAARHDPGPAASLRLVVTGGANLPASVRDDLAAVLPDVQLISYYGAAEIGFIGDSRDGDGTRIRLYDGIDAQVRGDDGRPVPDGELGTLWIRAAACSDGYVAATTDAVLRDADGWATVHDQGRLRGRALELAGRAGDIAVTGGHKVSLAEVERAFDGMPGVGAVCAITVPHPSLGDAVVLVVEGEHPAKAELATWAHEHLAPQFVPRRWYWMPQLPRTVGGKVRRGMTAEIVAGGEGAARL